MTQLQHKRKALWVTLLKTGRTIYKKANDIMYLAPEKLTGDYSHYKNRTPSEFSEDPYQSTQTMISGKNAEKLIYAKINELRTKCKEYYRYTNGKILPEDLFMLTVYRRELNLIKSNL